MSSKVKNNVPTVLRRMRESSKLTMRQAGGIIGISHVAISQFENEKLSLPEYRIEQMVKTYGFTMDDFYKIMGKAPAINLKDDCHAMIDRIQEQQLAVVRSLLSLLLQSNPDTKNINE